MVEQSFQKLIDIMETLRGKDGCPWDREQTHQSLKPFLLEETYEVLETIDEENFTGLKEELGDLLLQVVFHARLAEESGRFSIKDVLHEINAKLIRRHPHVFGQKKIRTADEQRSHWERMKKDEGKSSVLDGVPRSIPALYRASRIQQKAASVGFDWEIIDQVWEKVDEEMGELKESLHEEDPYKITEEFGDLLFALVNLSRFIKVQPEDALRQAIDKFIDRFRKLEKVMDDRGVDMHDASLEELDAVWDSIK